jgi:hypothetical protein
MLMFDVFISLLFAASLWFAYACGVNDCKKNSCFRVKKDEDDNT